jgi:5'-deoxynucleotidase
MTYLPKGMQETYRPLVFEETDEDVMILVKAADKLAAYIKCVEELKTGNNEFKKASEQVYETLKNMELPELDYFLQHFLPSFSLSLDELE